MIIDTHCHYSLVPLSTAVAEEIATAKSHGVIAAVCPSVDTTSSKQTLELAKKYPDYIYPAIGIHPSNATNYSENDLSFLANSLSEQQNICAIGEFGLDYFRIDTTTGHGSETRSAQISLFEAHLALAAQHHLPIILHIRDANSQAYTDVYEILASHQFSEPVIFHCLSGPEEIHLKFQKDSYYYSVAGNCTYPSAEPLRNLLSHLPISQLLTETDAPYLAPQKWRGSSCKPYMITETVSCLSTLLSVKPDVFAKNALALFATMKTI